MLSFSYYRMLKLFVHQVNDVNSIIFFSIPEEVQEQIGTAFASETNRRDEDTEM